MKTLKLTKLFLSIGLLLCLVILSGCCELLCPAPHCPECPQCPVCPPCQGPPDDGVEIVTFNPAPMTRLCPTHVGGDREFNGHGPDVTANASLEIRNSNREVWIVLYLHAKETRSDWTEAERTWSQRLWTAPSGSNIVNIVSDESSNASYRDTDHDLDRPTVRGGTLVSVFEIMGDTGGNDVGNCTSGDVYMNVYFNPVQVRIQNTN